MSISKWNVGGRWAIVAVAAGALAGCLGGGGSGAAAVATIGGAPGAGCYPASHAQGCTTVATKPTKVECKDNGTGGGTWTALGECATGEYCAEEQVAGEAATKKTAVCKVIPAGGGGGGGTGTTDGGPAKTPAQEFACIEQQCASAVAACSADPKCATILACAKACPDEACSDKCAETLTEQDQAAFAAALGMATCGAEKGCISVCGNGKCEAGENQTSCAEDCKPAGPTCGDGKCEAPETTATCDKDCKAVTPTCGDGKCQAPETTASCAQDCPTGGPICGDGKCETPETTASCAQDCKATGTPVCGDGKCDSGETACAIDCDAQAKALISCATSKCVSQYAECMADPKCATAVSCYLNCKDDGACINGCMAAAGGAALTKGQALLGCATELCSGGGEPICGNGVCEEGETTSSCSKDCKATGPVCGNGVCEMGETTSSCSKDCKTAGPVCGNETCESGESYANCQADCPCTADSQCGSGKKCIEGACMTQSTATCGDLSCAAGENCTMDCNPDAKKAVLCAMEACSEYTQCKSNSGCWKAFVCANQCGENESCINGCGSQAGSGLSILIALAECTQKQCAPTTGPVCGNGTCESGETVNSCPIDCKAPGCTSNSQCAAGQTCQAGVCKTSSSGCPAACTQPDAKCVNGLCTKVTTGSCAAAGSCGGQSADGCYCDDLCEQPNYEDCCPDKKLVCVP